MKLFNTQTQQIETFQPDDNEVTLYVCGITPYDTTHLGHAFTYCAADVLVRYLEMKGWRVKYAQNVTDIDDDIIKKAEAEGENWRSLGNRWTRHFIEDMRTLNVRPPDYFPQATAVIPQIIETVQALLAAGVAYEEAGNVYFQVDAWPDFGRLSQISRPDMLPIANERGNHPDDPHKKDPLDFVLWQAHKADEPAWQSPWGNGRPGWHIECSTMVTHFLGQPLDIHIGGADLLFPHHECEIAQVESLNSNEPFVRFWLHTAMVEHEGQKMGKSLGNLVMVRDLLQLHSPDTIRIYLAQQHYRQSWAHNELSLRKAARIAEKLNAALAAVSTGDQPINVTPAQKRFTAVMDNDLDTVKGIATLLNLADEIIFRAPNGYQIKEAQAALRRMASVFGLCLDEELAERRVITGWNDHWQNFRKDLL
jgi:L-cysteine:1D-myo-inositol 2-amino-2-deoxy-alpha-D-glucopyranoside ligase